MFSCFDRSNNDPYHLSGELLVSGKGTCQGDIEGLMRECAVYVQRPGPKVNPSAGCCSVVKRSDIGCACGRITASVQKMIDMDKVVLVTAFCGKPLAHGTKCGSYVIPSIRLVTRT